MPEGLTESDPERVAELLKVFAHPIRLKIISVLSQYRELNVTSIQEQVAISQSLISHHLLKMNDKGVLIKIRGGQEIYYSLADPMLAECFSSLLNMQKK